jgi:uncharacterized protein YktB (UPF0637 family)
MNIPGFHEEDFQVFAIDGLQPRMEAIKERIRPKLEMIGARMEPVLTGIMGEPAAFHVAKHARRTVHPPEETWVAWSTSKRGYKSLPHFQLGLRDTHLFVWFAMIYECDRKVDFARALSRRLEEFWPAIPDDFWISQDHTVPDALRKGELTEEDARKILSRLEMVKKAEFLCGVLIPRKEAVKLPGEELITRLEAAFAKLEPIYRLAAFETVG